MELHYESCRSVLPCEMEIADGDDETTIMFR